ncbi:hypothetical protein [uncultured Desulfovibrio sp.]|uniref:hypothetical protein n=1 Tax=uncultured Desulfovibrio sp. TaxID=167968 RepID=UPI00261ABCB7|nr:hypothetical protein [uncultured Desulfovibrio sp.]
MFNINAGCNVLTPLGKWLFGRDMPFRVCCDEHDLFYDQGGSAADRTFADRVLRECIRSMGYPVSAWIVWICVRLFGGSHWPDA